LIPPATIAKIDKIDNIREISAGNNKGENRDNKPHYRQQWFNKPHMSGMEFILCYPRIPDNKLSPI
jgi:hypothetical protein